MVARVCLDMLRSRKSRREEPLETAAPEPAAKQGHCRSGGGSRTGDSVGYATLVVLRPLNPAERIAFVLHDLFDFPFEEIARITGATPEAVRQLASRARRRVRRGYHSARKELEQQHSLVERFLAGCARRSDEAAGCARPGICCACDTGLRRPACPSDVAVRKPGRKKPSERRGVPDLAHGRMVRARSAVIVAPRGRLFRVLQFTFANGRLFRWK